VDPVEDGVVVADRGDNLMALAREGVAEDLDTLRWLVPLNLDTDPGDDGSVMTGMEG
jgi:hypothetical protein